MAQGEMVLVVDDNSFNIAVIEAVLVNEYQVKVACDRGAALAAARGDNPPDLILIDASNPLLRGYDICRALQGDEKTREIPIVFITKRGEGAGEGLGLRLGAVDYMTLAISPVVMRARIRNHILMRQRTRRLQELNQLKNGMISMVAHDLRNPLSAIQGFAGLARRSSGDEARQREYIGIIEQGASQLLRMVGDLLDYSVIEHGGMELNRKAGDLARLARERCRLFAGNERASEVQLLVGGAEQAPATFDEDRMRQVVDNLIGNALKFSPANTVVSVAVEAVEGGVCLVVEDQGPGMPPEDLDRIFQPFTRSKARPLGKEKGIGLGLSIVRNIVVAHGGTIRVESEEGRGAKFSVWLPGSRTMADGESSIH